MRSTHPYTLILIILILLPVTGTAAGDDGGCPGSSCDFPVYLEPSSQNLIIVNNTADSLWDENTYLNGSLKVEQDLTISGINLTIGGQRIIVDEGAVLTVIDSTIDSYNRSFVYHMEISGSLVLRNTTLINCLDPLNSYFGIYVSGGYMELEGSDLSRSGIIQIENSTASVIGCSLTGMISLYSDAEVANTTILSFGLSQIGDGIMKATGLHITSNLTFSIGVSGLSVLNGGELIARDIEITGTYNAGIFSSYSHLDLSVARIELVDGLYGVKMDNTTMKTLRDVLIDGGLGGLSLYGCTGEVSVYNMTAKCHEFGMVVDGLVPATVSNSSFLGSRIGAVGRSPLQLVYSTMKDNEIGVRMELGYHLAMTDCRIEDYSEWGVVEQSWEIVRYPENTYVPAPGAKGQIAWFGLIPISIRGPENIPVKGSMLRMSSDIDDFTKQDPGVIDLVWGYSAGTGITEEVQYDVEVSWKQTTAETTFTPTKGFVLDVYLPMTDIRISGIEYRNGEAVVSIISNGTGVDNVEVSLYADGYWRGEATISLEPDEPAKIIIPLDLDEGAHNLMARAGSVDEYKGSNGMLQENNEMTRNVIVEEEEDRGTFLIWLAVTGIILLFLVPFLIKDRTKS
ncbi:MAG: hypothetical protein ACMUIG_05655 [Thermoplasmatota archaeon]